MQLFKKAPQPRNKERPSTTPHQAAKALGKVGKLTMATCNTPSSGPSHRAAPDTPGAKSARSSATRGTEVEIRFSLQDLLAHINTHTKYPSMFIPIAMQAEPLADVEPATYKARSVP